MTGAGSAARRSGCSCEKAPLGTAGALTIARETLDPRFLMMNGDAFFDINLRALEQAALEGGAMATLALRSVPDAARYGRVIEEQGKVVAFLEKDPSRPGPGIINGGIYVLKREILDLVSALPCSLEQDVFPALVERGQIRGKAFDGYFLDIGLPETLEQGHRELPNVRVRPAAFFDRDALLNVAGGDSIRGGASMDGGRDRGHSRPERPRLLCLRDKRRGERRVAAERGDAGVARARRGACRPVHRRGRLCLRRSVRSARGSAGTPDLFAEATAEWPIVREKSFFIVASAHDIEAARGAGLAAHLSDGGDLARLVDRLLARPAQG